MKFIKIQQHRKSCGPVAVINAVKFFGGNISYKKYIKMFEALGFHFDKGTYWISLGKMLKAFGLKFKVIDDPTLDELFALNKPFIMSKRWWCQGKSSRHMSFHVPSTNKRIIGPNFYCKSNRIFVQRKDLIDQFKISGRHGHAIRIFVIETGESK